MNSWRYKLPCGHRNWAKATDSEKYGINRNQRKVRWYCKTCCESFEYTIHLKSGNEVSV